MEVVYVEPGVKDEIDRAIEEANVMDKEIDHIMLLAWEWDQLLTFFEEYNGIRHDRNAPFYYRGVMLKGTVLDVKDA